VCLWGGILGYLKLRTSHLLVRHTTTWAILPVPTLPIFFLLGLEFKLRALGLQSRHSTAWAVLPVHLLWLFWKWGFANYYLGLVLASQGLHHEPFHQCLSIFNCDIKIPEGEYFVKKESLLSSQFWRLKVKDLFVIWWEDHGRIAWKGDSMVRQEVREQGLSFSIF
jgi:hypothetical protein